MSAYAYQVGRSLVLAHYLDVHCSCKARRVLSLAMMARDRRVATYTLAHVALKLRCQGCYTGPDRVHLTATTYGIGPAAAGDGGLVWTLPLVDRPTGGARQLRHGQRQQDRVLIGWPAELSKATLEA